MKHALFAAVAVVCFACAALPVSDGHTALNQSVETVRGWRVEDGHVGEHLNVPALGKVTVLDFWSTSCKPCIASMPALEQLWQKVDRSRVEIIGVSIDTDDALTRKTMKEKFPVQVTFPMIYDGKSAKLQGIYKVGGTVPSTFVIDKSGRIRFYFDGSKDDTARLEQAINALINE